MSMAIASPRCIDCLGPKKSYELDEAGRCATCDRLYKRFEPPPPPFPTEHMPGTIGRLIVLEWRAESGWGLYHEADAQDDERPNLPSRHHTQRAAERHVYPCYASV
jgi:hypothetical protein